MVRNGVVDSATCQWCSHKRSRYVGSLADTFYCEGCGWRFALHWECAHKVRAGALCRCPKPRYRYAAPVNLPDRISS